ncbi:hypothetical protein ACNKHV_21635 [Shigella flexneri]
MAAGYACWLMHPQAGNLGGGGFHVNPLEKWQYHGYRFPRKYTRQS